MNIKNNKLYTNKLNSNIENNTENILLTKSKSALHYFPNIAILLLAIAIAILFLSCSGRFAKREELKHLNDKWGGKKIYLLKKDVNIGNGRKLIAGTKVRIWFESNSFSVKLKAYLVDESREKAYGKNLIYLHESDFENEEYDRKVFEKKIIELIKAAK